MATATRNPVELLMENFDISEYLGQRATTVSRVLTLHPGQTTKFKTLNGEDAEIEVKEMRVNGCASVKHPSDTKEKANWNGQFFIDCEVRMADENGNMVALPYSLLTANAPHHIYGQNWQTSVSTATELVKFLVGAGFFFNGNPRKQENQKFGNRWECSAGQPSTDAAGNPQWDSYGVRVSELVVGSTYNVVPENAQRGFRDFATEAMETFKLIQEANEIEDPEARLERKKDMSRFILSATGGRDDGWPRNAQINSITLAVEENGETIEKKFDLWTAQEQTIDLASLIPETAPTTQDGTPTPATTGTLPDQLEEEPF